jgi:hypothetical protein
LGAGLPLVTELAAQIEAVEAEECAARSDGLPREVAPATLPEGRGDEASPAG